MRICELQLVVRNRNYTREAGMEEKTTCFGFVFSPHHSNPKNVWRKKVKAKSHSISGHTHTRSQHSINLTVSEMYFLTTSGYHTPSFAAMRSLSISIFIQYPMKLRIFCGTQRGNTYGLPPHTCKIALVFPVMFGTSSLLHVATVVNRSNSYWISRKCWYMPTLTDGVSGILSCAPNKT